MLVCSSVTALSLCDKLRVNTLVMDTESWMRLCSVDDYRYHGWVVVMFALTSGGRCCLEEQRMAGYYYKYLMTVNSTKEMQDIT